MRQAPRRVARLALLDASVRLDTQQQRERRHMLITFAASGRFHDVPDLLFPSLLYPDQRADDMLRASTRR